MPDEVVTLAGRPVHRVGFGAMQLPGPRVFGPPPDRDRALRILRLAVEWGVDHIDTAQFYGPDVANELIRAALYPYPDRLVLVSKVGARRDGEGQWLEAQRPEELRAGVEANLKTLGVERLAVVNLRRHPDATVGFDEQIDAMIAIRDEGLIDGIGLSNVTLEQFRTARERTEVACVQNAYSVSDRRDQPVFDACRDAGVPYVPFFPLGSAFAPVNPVLTHPDVVSAGQRLTATPAQVALAWLLAQSPNVLLIPGTSSPDHLKENLAVAELELDAEARSVLDNLRPQDPPA